MQTTHLVGIDLGTTYSCISYLNEQGEPVTLPNQEGELATPSVVLFDGDRAIVGTKALRNAIRHPAKVVENSKRFMGDVRKRWVINDRPYTPVDIATVILKKLISAGQEQIGPIEQAVITVPAQFSDAQRHATIEAGHRAGLKRVDIINEPVAAALCHVLGEVGIWFDELAREQRILVYDLGGGTFDLSLVAYQKDEVSVITSSGDLNLGGIDWNQALIRHVAGEFQKEMGSDPRLSREAMQYLSNEAEQAKRSLSVRPTAAMACRHDDRRKTYQITRDLFEELTSELVEHTAEITKRMLKDNKMGWAHVDVVLTTGGASRMPMIRNRLKELSGTTLNTSLSPDLSIAHGATYYAGMLLKNDKFAKSILSKEAARRLSSFKQRSVNARALGILVRNPKTNQRVPHYILPANTPLPADVTHTYGTVVPDQRRVHLQIVESGIAEGQPHVVLGNCIIHDLPPDLPEGSEIAVTISYDSEARVHVSAKDAASGKRAHTQIVRQENVVPQLASDHPEQSDLKFMPGDAAPAPSPPAAVAPARTQPQPQPPSEEQPRRAFQPAPQKPAASQPQPRKPAARPAPQPAEQQAPKPKPIRRPAAETQPAAAPRPVKPRAIPPAPGLQRRSLDEADQPVPLCNECGEPLDNRGQCPACGAGAKPAAKTRPARTGRKPAPAEGTAGVARRKKRVQRQRPVPPPADDAEILELGQTGQPAATPQRRKPVPQRRPAAPRPANHPSPAQPRQRKKPKPESKDTGEDEFWQLVDD